MNPFEAAIFKHTINGQQLAETSMRNDIKSLPFYKVFNGANELDFTSVYKVLKEDYDKVLKIYHVMSAHTYCFPLIDADMIDEFSRKARITSDSSNFGADIIENCHKDTMNGKRAEMNRV